MMIISRTTQCSEEITGQQKKLEHGPWQVLLISSPSYPHTHTHIREFGIKSSGAQVTEKLFPGFQVYLQVPD